MTYANALVLAAVGVNILMLSAAGLLIQGFAQNATEGQQIIVIPAPERPQDDGTDWGTIIAAVIVGILAGVARFYQSQRDGTAKKNVELAKDRDQYKEAGRDLALFGAKAFAANVDGRVTQDEYDALMQDFKALVEKWGEKFGVAEELKVIMDGIKPT